MIRINFKQPKYIFPLVIFVPLCALIYFMMQMFSGNDDKKALSSSNGILTDLPAAEAQESEDKLIEMTKRFGDEDAFTAVDGIGVDRDEVDTLEHGYSETELDQIDAAEAERIRQQREREELERSLAESRKHINSYAFGGGGYSSGSKSSHEAAGSYGDYSSREDYASELEEIQRRSFERQKAIEKSLGIGKSDDEESLKRHRADSIRRVRQEEKEKNRPMLVIKSKDANSDKFNTVSAVDEAVESKLIRAMIDQTTKAKEGTRLRFKLLDDVVVSNVKLRKGSYLYGIVSGFSQQRVKAVITSILAGDRFITVKLSVFDNDGMEGFYVPASEFREFVKDATASSVQQNINIDSDGYGSGISGEAVALQALQNMYNSATSAISANIRKNKARIKYNTVVYLINSDEAR